MSPPPDPGPICPSCGAPLRRRGAACPHCPEPTGALQWGVLTPFGYGVCGAAIGTELALLVNMCAAVGRYQLLLVMVSAATAATLFAQVGKRLVPALRRSYEWLLLGLLVGGLVAVGVTWVGPRAPGLATLLWLLVTAAFRHAVRGAAAPRRP